MLCWPRPAMAYWRPVRLRFENARAQTLQPFRQEDELTAECIFCQIVGGNLPSTVLSEGSDWIVFADIAPAAPIHWLAIPKRHISGAADLRASDELLTGQLIGALTDLARSRGIDEAGYRLVINQGRDGLQTVEHLHVHLLAGRPMAWPPG